MLLSCTMLRMDILRFTLKPHIDVDEAWDELTTLGAQLLWSAEDPLQANELFGILPPDLSAETFVARTHSIDTWSPMELPSTDWKAQWETHGFDFHDGYVHVPIEEKMIKLEPGPGFGDLSHATTRLVLEMMSQQVLNQTVLDVGCGSGILALGAIAMGSPLAYGIDIDRAAIEHAHHNAQINGMAKQNIFCSTEEFLALHVEGPLTVAMNMIRTEQEQAWKALQPIHAKVHTCFTSGLMVEEREQYLKQCQQWGWKLVSSIEQDGWLGFHFAS